MVWGQRKSRQPGLTQRGEAVFYRKPRLSDKIAEGVTLGLLGPVPRFGSLGLLLGKQTFKSIKNNMDIVRRWRRQQSGVGLLGVLSTAAKQGVKLSKSKDYRRYGPRMQEDILNAELLLGKYKKQKRKGP